MYFENCATAEEAKRTYRRLAKIHHPDLGGDTATMAAINAEYERFTIRRPDNGYSNYYQPKQEQKKPQTKHRKKSIYSEDTVREFEEMWIAGGGKVSCTEDGHKVFYSRRGYKFTIVKYECTRNGKRYYTKRCYNEIPKKYYYCTWDREWD